MVVHERLEFADDLFLDAMQNYCFFCMYANLQQKLLLFCYFLLSIRVIPTFSNFSTYSFTSSV